MKKDTTMEKLEQVDELIHKAVDGWKKGDLAAYNESLRKARHIIFQAYYSETYGEKEEMQHDTL